MMYSANAFRRSVECAILLMSAVLFFQLPAQAQSECPDYFNDEWGVPLTMSDAAHGVLTDIPSAQTKFVSAYSYNSGVLSFTSTGTVPTLTLLQYTIPGSIPVGTRYGALHPINSSFYRIFRTRLYASKATVGSVFWFHDAGRYAIGNFSVSQGWNDYAIDLSTLTPSISNGANPLWLQGSPEGLVFIPSNESGVDIGVDHIYLTSSDCVTGTVSETKLLITRPDKKGGADFAQTSIGNSWNMNAASDLFAVGNVARALLYPSSTLIDPEGTSHSGDFVYTENEEGNGDPGLVVVSRNGQIDTARFLNFCFRGYNRDDTAYNSVARIFWADPREGTANSSYKVGDDIVLARGMREYCVDMREQAQLEPPLPAGSPNPWTSISEAGYLMQYLRLDMNEVSSGGGSPYHSVVDQITLRSDHEAHTQYAIVVAAEMTQAVDVYLTSAKVTSGGTLIGSLPADRESNVLKVDTSSFANGIYYVYATATRNGHTVTRLADGRLRVNHSLPQDLTSPILECERPSEGYTFDSQLEFAGYALDETRLGTVEAFVDGNYFATIEPDKFHLVARDAYALYSESNAPGFQTLSSPTGIGYGSHTIRVVATDTAGNESTCTRNVTRVAGGDTTPLVYPSANSGPTSLSIGNGSFPAKQRPGLRVKISRKKNVKFAFTRLKSCSALTILASSSDKMTNPRTIFNDAVNGSFSRSINNFPAFGSSRRSNRKGPKTKNTGDGKIYIQLQCSNGAYNTPVVFDVKKKIKNRRKLGSEDALISLIDESI